MPRTTPVTLSARPASRPACGVPLSTHRYANRDDDVIPSERYRAAMSAYWEHMQTLLRHLMELTALALGLPRLHFQPFYSRPNCALRLAHVSALWRVACASNLSAI